MFEATQLTGDSLGQDQGFSLQPLLVPLVPSAPPAIESAPAGPRNISCSIGNKQEIAVLSQVAIDLNVTLSSVSNPQMNKEGVLIEEEITVMLGTVLSSTVDAVIALWGLCCFVQFEAVLPLRPSLPCRITTFNCLCGGCQQDS